ncbi:MAG: hypothetical protein LBP35_04235 [Candidatus Ancillula trichonymphae]|nr:hypothetical protein [Candidatus Ancillula trichonymphae]
MTNDMVNKIVTFEVRDATTNQTQTFAIEVVDTQTPRPVTIPEKLNDQNRELKL